MNQASSLRDSVYVKLADTLLRAIEEGSIPEQKSRELSKYILRKGEYIRSNEQLLLFLEVLSEKWDQYNPFYVQVKYEAQKGEEKIKIAEIQAKLGTFIHNLNGKSSSRN